MSKAGREGSAAGPCRTRAAGPIMLPMTPLPRTAASSPQPASPALAAAAATRRLILVPASPRADQGDATVRRYRIARLRLAGRALRPRQAQLRLSSLLLRPPRLPARRAGLPFTGRLGRWEYP